MEKSTVSIDIGWQSRVVVGRFDAKAEDNPDISLDFLNASENGVSRRHAALFWRNRVFQIEDLGSTNGTWVNGQQLKAHQPRSIGDGDVIQLGRIQLRLRFPPNRNYPPSFIASIVQRSPARTGK